MPLTSMLSSLFGSSSQDHSLDQGSRPGCPLNEEHLLSQSTLNDPSFTPDIYGLQHFNPSYQQQQQQHALPSMLPVNCGIPNHIPQPEFFGHNIDCAPYTCYGGMMPSYGPRMIPPQSADVPARMLLAPEIGPNPVFVNPKQYDAILRRRKSRAKAENEKKLIKNRKPYLHESRHLHAKNRARGTGGRFSKREEVDSSKTTASGSLKSVRPESSETPRQSNHASPGYHSLSWDFVEDWLDISPPNQG